MQEAVDAFNRMNSVPQIGSLDTVHGCPAKAFACSWCPYRDYCEEKLNH